MIAKKQEIHITMSILSLEFSPDEQFLFRKIIQRASKRTATISDNELDLLNAIRDKLGLTKANRTEFNPLKR